MAYKSTRLLVEAIHSKMDEARKRLMQTVVEADDGMAGAFESMNELRTLIDELSEKANVPTIDELNNMSVGDYVRTMKPLVARYHRQLLVADKLTACLCEDTQSVGCVLILIGEKTIVRTSYDPEFPNAQMGVEAVLQALENMNKTMQEGVEAYEDMAGVEAPREGDEEEDEFDGDDDDEPLRVRYADPIQNQDIERNERAALVIDMNDEVIKDRFGGPVPRKATQEEIDSCIVVKDLATGVGYEDELP